MHAIQNRSHEHATDEDPIYDTIPERLPTRPQDLLWWAATGMAVVVLASWLTASLTGCGDALVSVGPPGGAEDDDAAGDDDAADDDDVADDDDDDTAEPEDLDGDGWSEDDGDCDDSDPDVHPGATEQCDEVDHDCNGDPMGDGDGDGFDVCEDCDDTDPDVYPGAPETNGDGVDSDCDGADDLDLGGTCYGDDNVIGIPELAEYSIDWDDASGDVAGNNHYYDDVEFLGVAGDVVTIAMYDWEWGLDPYLYLLDPNCQVVAEDDNSAAADNDDALIEYEIPAGGVYTIIATSAGSWETGDYQLETW